MKVIFTSNRFIDFIIRLLITAIVISPVIIWSWDTVKETTADGMLAAAHGRRDACRCFRYPLLRCAPVYSVFLFFCPD
ncbi:TPA: conjugal transfer protein TrbE [Escherichia coli]